MPLPPYINVEPGQILLLSAYNFGNNIEKGVFHQNFYFQICLNSFVQDCRYKVQMYLLQMEYIIRVSKIPSNYGKDCRYLASIFLLLKTAFTSFCFFRAICVEFPHHFGMLVFSFEIEYNSIE